MVEEKNKEPTQQELIERLQRMQAEFENFRKRTEKENTNILASANANLVLQLLDVLDNFELSFKHSKDQGVKLIYNQFAKVLEKNGLKYINTTGTFNPNVHEAIIQVPGKKDGEIIEEIQKGYSLNDKLLRASKVKIVKGTQ